MLTGADVSCKSEAPPTSQFLSKPSHPVDKWGSEQECLMVNVANFINYPVQGNRTALGSFCLLPHELLHHNDDLTTKHWAKWEDLSPGHALPMDSTCPAALPRNQCCQISPNAACRVVQHMLHEAMCCICCMQQCAAYAACSNVLHMLHVAMCCICCMQQCAAYAACSNVLHMLHVAMCCICCM